jgi:branched-chain amino acid transport system substrate-binding protein
MFKRVLLLVKKRIYPIILGLLLVPLLGAVINWIVIDRLIARARGPDSYKIYVVGNLEREDSAAQQIYTELTAEGELKTFDGTPIEVELKDDQGDPDQARQLATKIAAKNDTLMVIGHIGSTQTKAALPVYFTANPPVPVILTTETNPNLTPPKLLSTKRFPLFRLSPNDDQQAKSAAKFMQRVKAKAIWVVEDVDNPVYSSYLGSEFIRLAQQGGNRRVLLLTDIMHVPSANAFKALNIDWVFFAGDSDHAVVLVHQIQQMYGRISPRIGILLTDASADQDLIREGDKDVEGVYLTYPMKAKQYQKSGFRIYGAMAHDVINYLIALSASSQPSLGFAYEFRHLLGIRRVHDARRLLAAVIEDAQTTQARFVLTNPLINEISLQFRVGDGDDDGTRADQHATFDVWQVCQGRFKEVPAEPTAPLTPSCPAEPTATADAD